MGRGGNPKAPAEASWCLYGAAVDCLFDEVRGLKQKITRSRGE